MTGVEPPRHPAALDRSLRDGRVDGPARPRASRGAPASAITVSSHQPTPAGVTSLSLPLVKSKTTEDPPGQDTIRIHLPAMDDRARALQNQPTPPQSGTKHL